MTGASPRHRGGSKNRPKYDWHESVAVCTAPRNPSKLILRSYFENTQTGRVVWNEPPTGSESIRHASEETWKLARKRQKDLQMSRNACCEGGASIIKQSSTPETEMSSSSSSDYTDNSLQKTLSSKLSLFQRTWRTNSSGNEKHDDKETSICNTTKSKKGVDNVDLSEPWQETYAVCKEPRDPSNLSLRTYYKGKKSGKVVWNYPPKGAKVIRASVETKKRAVLDLQKRQTAIDKEERKKAANIASSPRSMKRKIPKTKKGVFNRRRKENSAVKMSTPQTANANNRGTEQSKKQQATEKETIKESVNSKTMIHTQHSMEKQTITPVTVKIIEGPTSRDSSNEKEVIASNVLDTVMQTYTEEEGKIFSVTGKISVTTSCSTVPVSNITNGALTLSNTGTMVNVEPYCLSGTTIVESMNPLFGVLYNKKRHEYELKLFEPSSNDMSTVHMSAPKAHLSLISTDSSSLSDHPIIDPLQTPSEEDEGKENSPSTPLPSIDKTENVYPKAIVSGNEQTGIEVSTEESPPFEPAVDASVAEEKSDPTSGCILAGLITSNSAIVYGSSCCAEMLVVDNALISCKR